MGDNAKLGKYIVLQDAYGNQYTYAQLGSIAKTHPVPRAQHLSAKDFKLETPNKDSAPNAPATAGDNSAKGAAPKSAKSAAPGERDRATPRTPASASSPCRSASGNAGNPGVGGQLDQLLGRSVPGLRDLQVGTSRAASSSTPRRWS